MGYLAPLVCISIFVPVPYCSFEVQSEVRKVDSSSSILSQNCFGCWVSFAFPYELYIFVLVL